MANATAITVTSLSRNSSVVQATADVLDTGTTAVTISADITGQADRAILEVKNTAAANLTVAVLAGDNPPAQAAGLGSLSATLAENAVRYFGPFEGMRFIQDNGKLDVTFTPASGTIGVEIRCYVAPKV